VRFEPAERSSSAPLPPASVIFSPVFPQHGVDPRLPSGAGGAEEVDEVGIEAQRNQLLSPFLPALQK
jgi:hypothetical protein